YAGVSVKDKNVLVLGSGGASNVALVALKDAGAKSVTVVSRSGAVNYENCYELSQTEIIVNATPVGTFPEIEAAPIDIAKFKKLDFLFDLIYNPFKTELIKKAERLGIGRLNGLCMLVIQALKAREIWTGTPYSVDDIKNCLKSLKEKTVNIALCGMPSSGKSTVGRLLSEKLGKEFYDTDEVVFSLTGRTPEEIIISDGEKAFRDVEEKAVASVCEKRGVVIALGGGAVLREKNREILNATAFTAWLKRDLELLDDTDRPTLKQAGAVDLYKMRAPVYESVSDFSVLNDNLAEDAAKEIIKAYEDFGY
ncbi:MAG: shikimate kinase, partial [Clostridia bacterium]|nr:shikimate kinase [Clostridia bacterium]